ncbi:MAG: proton-conducting membrane transporter [Myxococcota bacterium]|nr:proton-conducting membrane transporter [Myxococcota bacterium]
MIESLVSSATELRVAVALVPLLPILTLVIIGASMAIGRTLSERAIAGLTTWSISASLLLTLVLGARWVALGGRPIDLRFGAWFGIAPGSFEVRALIDTLSLSMLLLTQVVTAMVARFSTRYLHRERGFARFFMLICLFATGMHVLVLAGSFDLLFAGWELVGLSSILLVGFYHSRPGATRAAVRVMITYRVADVGLLVAGVLLHQFAGSAELVEALDVARLPRVGATIIALALLLATMGKSALFPLGGWLPRAMEGPTPSSALFYGALSVHAGVYLLLRSAPLLEASPIASAAVGTVGAITAVYASMVGRTQSDAKSALAYATMTQVGLMLVAIGLHLWTWTLIHMVAHVMLRLFQLLRSPSALRDAQEIRAALASAPVRRAGAWTRLVPESALVRLHALARQRFFVDELVERAIVRPTLAISRGLDALERRVVAGLSGWPRGAEPDAPSAVLDAPARSPAGESRS